MPKRSANEIVEQRISLSPVAAAVAREKIQAEKQTAVVKAIGTGGGMLGLAAAAGLGAYALYKWAGLGDLGEKFSDWSKGVVMGFYKVTGAQEGLDNYVKLSSREFQQEIFEIEKICAERHAELDAIIASPNSSENQVAQAQADKTTLDRNCKKAVESVKARARRWIQARINDPSIVITEGADYWRAAITPEGPDYIPPPN
jgi:hypothetical protein|tara:strand:+ start:1329 stop:1931 length:603 start_codon:yes stop_codon:yes gene_type:complete